MEYSSENRKVIAEYKEQDAFSVQLQGRENPSEELSYHNRVLADYSNVEVDYDDDIHRYFFGDLTYTSATQLIDRLKNKFDTPERSQYMASRYGMTPEYWVAKWKKISDESLVRGNGIHNRNEEFLYGRGIDTIEGQHFEVRNRNLYPDNISYITLPDGVYPELKLWNHEAQIAGRGDKIILRTENGGQLPGKMCSHWRVADVEDYKTNRIIYTQSWKDQITGEFLMMKGPLSHLMDCAMVHYTLQFSIYQYMLEKMGFLPGKRRLIHYQHEIEGLGTPKPVIHELPYLRDEVIAMLNAKDQTDA